MPRERERPIIELFLSEYDHGAWRDASLDWVEDRQDGAVEVIAKATGGKSLAIEHTLIQPFDGEIFDRIAFCQAFGPIKSNPEFAVRDRNLIVLIPCHAIPKGHDWKHVGRSVLQWLLEKHGTLPVPSDEVFRVPIPAINGMGSAMDLPIELKTRCAPGTAGHCPIGRRGMPGGADVVVKALRTKLPKLERTSVDARLLLLEFDQIALSDIQIYDQISVAAPCFPKLPSVHEIWFANTSLLGAEQWVEFTLLDDRGVVERLVFKNNLLQSRSDDRDQLGPPSRGF